MPLDPFSAIAPGKQQGRLRLIGILVLVLGFVCAGFVYWNGVRSKDSRLADYDQSRTRAESRQMGILYGKMGQMIEDFFEDLKRPATQAAIIAVTSAAIALACFYLARPLNESASHHGE